MRPTFRSCVQSAWKITRKFSFYSAVFLLILTLLTFFVIWNGDLTLELEVGNGFMLNPYFGTLLFYILLQILLPGIAFALSMPMVYFWKSWRGADSFHESD